MLIEPLAHLPTGFAVLQNVADNPNHYLHDIGPIALRWAHFVAGITWIGLLYFFNLVNVKLMKALDAPTKGKVIPELMPRALWFFRWGAVVTVLVGLAYYAMYILRPDVQSARDKGGLNVSGWIVLAVWLAFPIVTFVIEFFIIQKSGINDGRVLAVIVLILVVAMSVGIIWWFNSQMPQAKEFNGVSNKTFSIGIGGALGIIMLLNVWGIIWPAQKRIIAWTKDNAQNGTPIPPESAALGRKAFLASRTNAWLSLPMLFFMATSHENYITSFGQ
ncbi:MAG: hypothetical protein QOC96_1178 [Acidobacteriota bacterium]|jgi:uncharacterized membrane protein|nr:hypothetical protein [Acidobacteriota bacterium]